MLNLQDVSPKNTRERERELIERFKGSFTDVENLVPEVFVFMNAPC